MRHSMFPRSSGHIRGLSLQSLRTSCKCWCLEGERTHAVPDPAVRCRYVARLPRCPPLFVWSGFRRHRIPSEYVLLELRTSWGAGDVLGRRGHWSYGGFCPCCRAAIWAFSSAIVFCDSSSNCRSLFCRSWTVGVWAAHVATPTMHASAKRRVVTRITAYSPYGRKDANGRRQIQNLSPTILNPAFG